MRKVGDLKYCRAGKNFYVRLPFRPDIKNGRDDPLMIGMWMIEEYLKRYTDDPIEGARIVGAGIKGHIEWALENEGDEDAEG